MPGELSNLPTITTWRSFRCNILDSQLVDSPQDLEVQADHAESVLPAMTKIFWALGTRTKLSNSQFLGCSTFSSTTVLGGPGESQDKGKEAREGLRVVLSCHGRLGGESEAQNPTRYHAWLGRTVVSH